MNVFIKNFVLLELIVELSCVISYTVVLKRVKPLYPPVKVYRYELRQPKIITEGNTQYVYHKPVPFQRIHEHYPSVVKQYRDSSYRPFVLPKKEKRKYFSKTTEAPVPSDQRLYNLPHQLAPPVTNQIEEFAENKEEESQDQDNDIHRVVFSPHHEKSFTSFPQEKGRIYKRPGDWATPTPTPESENSTKSAFTPSQLYLQIRHKNTVIHVPQSEALKDAETLEELINAPRLKELARTTHVQEMYSEEGYEDGAYDHEGHIRHAQHGEVYDAKDEGKFKIKDTPIIIDYDSDLEESKKIPSKKLNTKESNFTRENQNEKIEPRITRSRSETSKMMVEYSKIPQGYKGGHKYSSRVKKPTKTKGLDEKDFNLTTVNKDISPTFPSYFGQTPPAPLKHLSTDETEGPITPVGQKPSKYQMGELNSTQIFPVLDRNSSNLPDLTENLTNFKPFISMIDYQASPSAKSLKYNRIYSKKTKQLRLEPYGSGKLYESPSQDAQDLSIPREKTEGQESINQRIVLPTIGYINSLTTAHFGKGSFTPPQDEPKTQITSALNLTQALDYLRSNKKPKKLESTPTIAESDISRFEPMKLKKSRSNSYKIDSKVKRDVFLVKERDKRSEEEVYEGNDSSDGPHNEKNEEIAEDERRRIEEENVEKEKYEKALKEEISKKEKEILRETFMNIGVAEDISETFPTFPSSNFESDDEDSSDSSSEPEEEVIDVIKYPFYLSKKLPENSPLRYATDPKKFPKKSGYKMEFYESREDVIQCPEFHPDLEDLPNSNSTEYSEDQAGENSRLTGLGDKIICLRMKYFGIEPFDNPIFKEKEIDYVGKPKRKLKVLQKSGSNTYEVKSNLRRSKTQFTGNDKNLSKPKKNDLYVEVTTADYNKKSSQSLNSSTPVPITNIKNLKSENTGEVPLKQIISHFPKPKTSPEIVKPSPVNYYEISFLEPPKINNPIKGQSNERSNYQPKFYPNLPVRSTTITPCHLRHLKRDSICNDTILTLNGANGAKNFRIVSNPSKSTSLKNAELNKRVRPKSFPLNNYFLPKSTYDSKSEWRPISRKTDEVTNTKNETSQTSNSDHYVIDELKEEENVRKGEVMDDMDHYLKLMNALKGEISEAKISEMKSVKNRTREKRETPADETKLVKKGSFTKKRTYQTNEVDLIWKVIQNWTSSSSNETEKPQIYEPVANRTGVSVPFESKRTLSRLSGKDFLTRYHKQRGKPVSNEKTADFWKVTNANAVTNQGESRTQHNSEREKTAGKLTTEKNFNAQESKQGNELRRGKIDNVIPEKILKRNEVKDVFKLENLTLANSTTDKYYGKPETTVQFNSFRRVSPSNIVPEKVTNKPERKISSEFRKVSVSISNPKGEEISVKPQNKNVTKIITKISRKTSEKLPKNNRKFEDSLNRGVVLEKPSYQVLNRSSTNGKRNETNKTNTFAVSSVGPVLFYIVDVKTGRGRWITSNGRRPKNFEKLSGVQKSGRRNKNDKREKESK